MIGRSILFCRVGRRALCSSTVLLEAFSGQYIRDFPQLQDIVKQNIFSRKVELGKEETIKTFKLCKSFQEENLEGDKFSSSPANEKIDGLIEKILLSENVKFDKDLLASLFLMKFPDNTNINIIKAFYKRNPKAHIERESAMIPFRYALFNGDVWKALKITDLTTGHENYVKFKAQQLKSGFLKLVGSALGITLFSKVGVYEIIEMGIISDKWRHLSSINSMILTYLLNSSFFLTAVKLGRQSSAGGGNYLTWQKGTFYNHWFNHADELAMAARILETDIALTGGGLSGGEPSKELIEDLCRTPSTDDGGFLTQSYTKDHKKIRLMEKKDNLEELKLQAYWMTGGDGFEWVEPDQDPAELIWKQHLEKHKHMHLKNNDVKSLKWAEDLIEDK